jgi:hypothetical protein
MAAQSGGKSRILRIEKRKRLEKLFERGRYVCFNADGSVADSDDGQWVERIYVASPNPFQRDQAMREGQAARARITLDARENSGSTDWVTIRSFISGLTHSDLVEFILNSKAVERLNDARREVLQEDEWDDFNQLRDSMRQYEEEGSPTSDPKWDSLLERDMTFATQVTDRADVFRDTESESLTMLPREALEKQAVEIRIENAGSLAFVAEYENWMMLYSVRDDNNHDELMFDELLEFKSMPRVFQGAVADTLAGFIDESSEAKN